MMAIYKIEFYKNIDYILNDYSYMSDIDKEIIANLDFDSMFEYFDLYDNYILYIISNEIEIEKYKKILNINLIPYLCTDMTKLLLSGLIDIEYELSKYVISQNEISYYKFVDNTNKFLLANLNLDDILDMIIDKGIDSLKQIHLEFLKTI